MFATLVSPPPPRRSVLAFFRALLAAALERVTRCRGCGGDATDDVHFYSSCPTVARIRRDD